ncbi:hypothetical protein E2C01_019590 [Portunus trituberculatus]|uniref:Uncharacterized protein n=1 Tax=Portunus trituberculatus TaxID=210409 RepID=A0A5B7DXM6_PORTR|nr:hypothetical protein [Portunus trituberculatus]
MMARVEDDTAPTREMNSPISTMVRANAPVSTLNRTPSVLPDDHDLNPWEKLSYTSVNEGSTMIKI